MPRLIALAVLLVATPALAQKVSIDYADDYSFDEVKTFQYVETPDSDAANPLMADRIESLLRSRLTESGLREVHQDPDIFVTYHLVTQERTVLSTSGYGYGGYGYGWRRYGGGTISASTSESTYTEGTLIVDAYEPSEKKMIWRGSGTVTVAFKPEKQVRQVEKILDKMRRKWAKILDKQGK